MGKYLNPGNSGFAEILQGEYIDKTSMIGLINRTIGTKQKLTCISRPRRFGKSYAAQMLCAYYDLSCDSHPFFDDKDIAKEASYEKHLNQYHVINLDIAAFVSASKRLKRPISDVPNMMVDAIYAELVELYPDMGETLDLTDCLVKSVEQTGRKFVFIIDEWDALIREAKHDEVARDLYLNLLREWFKNGNFTPRVVAATYMTGILPIKKDGSQSAISDFIEYPILYPGQFAEYTGFTEEEVRNLCEKHQMSYDEAKQWYDGYDFPDYGAIYNPYSVMSAIRNRKFRSYWQKTSAAESLMTYINMDFDGMQEIIARLIAGEDVEVHVDRFENDFETFKSRDDVLTLLIHLGYLTYNEDEGTAHIPNEEIRIEFNKIPEGIGLNRKWIELIKKSRQLLEDTIAGKDEAVAKAITEVRDTQYAPTYYNDEQALRYVIKFAYVAAVDPYLKNEELPSGRGIADVVYLPKRRSLLPAMIIELKWNKSTEGAIGQIKDRNYPAVLEEYGGEILLVGVNYDEKAKEHTCQIERLVK